MSSKKRQTIKHKKTIRSKSQLKKIYNYFFLVFLGSLVSISFLPSGPFKYFNNFWNVPAILTGMILIGFFFFLNRKRVSTILTESYFSHENSFSRNFLKTGLIVTAAFLVFSYHLDAFDFWGDEYLVVKAAEGYHRTGTYHPWNFIKDTPTQKKYTRAWPYTWLVAQSYRIFGVSEWSTRIVSVLFGCIFIGVAVFVTYFFTGDKFFSYLVAVVFLLNPDFIYYWRYARMYALLLPLFLILPAFVFKAIQGNPYGDVEKNNGLLSIREYLNLDYSFLALAVFVLYWAYQIHITPLIIFPIAFVFVIAVAIIEREKKYIGLIIFAIAAGLTGYVVIPKHILQYYASMMSLFQSINPLYLKLMVQKPFFSFLNLILLFGGLFLIPLASHKVQRRKLLFCLSIVLTALIFFVFLVDFFGKHYRYICHTIPFAILMICFVYMVIIRVYNNKYILIIGTIFLLAAQTGHFVRGIKFLYYGAHGQPCPSIAYATVKKNIKKGDAIFAQYLRDYYMKGIPMDTRIISLGRISEDPRGSIPYHFNQFFNDLLTHRRGWVIWQKYKEYHIDPKIVAYTMTLFKKYHGQGIDNTGVEIYYFDQSMIKIPNFK